VKRPPQPFHNLADFDQPRTDTPAIAHAATTTKVAAARAADWVSCFIAGG
jgi:hypothetical protein